MAGDGTYITIASVRRTVGISSTATMSDSDIGDVIAECEPQVARYYNTKFTPEERIDIYDGNGTVRLMLGKNPLLAVRELKIDGDTEDPANLFINKESGKIVLDTTQSLTNSVFKSGPNKIRVKYIHGFMEESSSNTTTDADSTAGTSVALSVASESGFADNDWVEIYGMDGYREAAQISGSPTTGEIVVDQLVQTHESGSKVVKLQIMNEITKLMNIIASIGIVARIIGQSATDIVGYTMSEFSVQKGEPYTQWRETVTQLIKERDMIMERIRPRMVIV